MTKDEALKRALEYVELVQDDRYNAEHIDREALVTDIKEALAQQEQTNTRPYYTIDELNAWADEKEKQAWRNAAIRIGEELSSVGPDGYYDMDAWKWLDWAMEQEPRGKNSLAQPEQSTTCGEPVACVQDLDEVKRKHLVYEKGMDWKDPLYTTPPQRTWVGLTTKEFYETVEGLEDLEDCWVAIEVKLKEKNT